VDGADYDRIELDAAVSLDITTVEPGKEALLHVEGVGDVRVKNDLSTQEWDIITMGGLLNAVRSRRAD